MSDEIEKHVLRDYQILKRVGKGAYGIVWRAIDKETKQLVALKKVFDAFQNKQDSQRTYREVAFLNYLKEHENIVQLLRVMHAENGLDAYLVFEYVDTDLHAVIKAGVLEDNHKRYIMYQLLRAVKYMHSGNALHRDLKPNNILIGADSSVRLCDFGLARVLNQGRCVENGNMTDYVATRWYRSPELLLGSTRYSLAVDMWAVGCILAELLDGRPLFPGSSTSDQIKRIVAITGRPSESDVESMESEYARPILENMDIFPSSNRSSKSNKPESTRSGLTSLDLIRQLHQRRRRSKPLFDVPDRFLKRFPSAPMDGLDLLRHLIVFDPRKRFDVEAAINHKYLERFRQPETELVFNSPILLPIDDDVQLSIKQYRDLLFNQPEEEAPLNRTKSAPKVAVHDLQPPETDKSPVLAPRTVSKAAYELAKQPEADSIDRGATITEESTRTDNTTNSKQSHKPQPTTYAPGKKLAADDRSPKPKPPMGKASKKAPVTTTTAAATKAGSKKAKEVKMAAKEVKVSKSAKAPKEKKKKKVRTKKVK